MHSVVGNYSELLLLLLFGSNSQCNHVRLGESDRTLHQHNFAESTFLISHNWASTAVGYELGAVLMVALMLATVTLSTSYWDFTHSIAGS